MIVLDFDGTLYDTHLLVADIFSVLKEFGIPEARAKETMKTAIEVDGNMHYDYTLERHIAALKADGMSLDEAEALSALRRLTETRDYTSPETIPFLDRMRALDAPMLLLTAGNEGFQRMKVDSTRIPKYMDDIVVVPGDKDVYMEGKEKEGRRIYFINDKVPENEQVKKRCPKIEVITKRNPYKLVGKGASTMDLPEFDSLLDIATYVEEHYG